MKFYVNDITATIPDGITVVAATKYFTANEMRELYNEGIHHFGENRDNAFLDKYQELQDLPITWHFIGTLQTKKVKKVVPYIDYLHSLDSIKLATEINKRRTAPLKCFIQVNISSEDNKHGLHPDDVIPFLDEVKSLTMIDVIGFMGMAEYTDDDEIIHRQFQVLNDLQETVKKERGVVLRELSIGMSNDYQVAIKHDATFLRLGSVLFKKEV